MDKKEIFDWIDQNQDELKSVAKQIWDNPETPFKENFASKLQSTTLEKAGFKIKKMKDIPTAFIAEYGSGRPILGVLGEYDALPGLSQKVSSKRDPIKKDGPGHGCGHNLLGTAGVGAVMAIKKAMESGSVRGTVRYYGCPAEEALAGKVFMAKEGVFDDLDACLTWHPSFMNTIWGCSFLAMNSVVFKFTGVASHAAATPHLGRSALDAVELMDIGANYLREHIDEKARIHYAITNGGGQPNTVPAEASVWYYIRAPKRKQVDEIFERLTKIAKGAAMMTETEVEWEFIAACYDVLPNEVLGNLLLKNMKELGSPRYTDEDRELAKQLKATIDPKNKEKIMESWFAPEDVMEMTLHEGVFENIDKGRVMAGSTDVGDVSYITPLAQMTAATWPISVTSHSWQATAASGSGIGLNAMIFVAKSIAGSLYELFTDGGETLKKAREEFENNTKGFKYKAPLPEGLKPPSN